MTRGSLHCDDCRCAPGGSSGRPMSADLAEVENRVFWQMRGGLEAPDPQQHPFYVLALDPVRKRLIARGYEPLSDALEDIEKEASEFESRVRRAAEQLEPQHSGVHLVTETLRQVYLDGVSLDEARQQGRSFHWVAGQDIGGAPTRLQQALTIRTAQVVPGEWNPSSEVVCPETHAVVVDNYIGDNANMDRCYEDACQLLGYESAKTGEGIATTGSLPHLVAEYLAFATDHESFAEFIERVETTDVGLAIVPMAVLGQYRAAALWMYQGHWLDAENAQLRAHVRGVRDFGAELLSRYHSTLIIESARSLFRKAFEHSASALVSRDVVHCGFVRLALAYLWCSDRIEIRKHGYIVQVADWTGNELTWSNPAEAGERVGDDTVSRGRSVGLTVDHEGAGAAIVHLRLAEDSAEDLGFDEVTYRCNHMPGTSSADGRWRPFERMVSDLVETVLRTGAIARRRATREVRRSVLDMLGHELANETYEMLRVVRDAREDPERLGVVEMVVWGFFSRPWVHRELARRNSAQLTLDWRAGAPSVQDVQFWKLAIQWQLRATLLAYGAGENRVHDRVRVALSFELPDGTVQRDHLSWADIRGDLLGASPFGDLNATDRATPWPLPIAASTERMAQEGRTAAIMWAPREMIRNAVHYVARELVVEGDLDGPFFVEIAARILARGHGWTIEVDVSNSLDRNFMPNAPRLGRSLTAIRETLEEVDIELDVSEWNAGRYVVRYRLRIPNDSAIHKQTHRRGGGGATS